MAKCIPCIGARLKEILKAQVPDKDLHKLLEKLDDCPKATQAKFCGSRVGERQRSAYNSFVADCIKGKVVTKACEASKAMSLCALEWKDKKGANGRLPTQT